MWISPVEETATVGSTDPMELVTWLQARGYAYGRAFVFDHTVLLTLAAGSAFAVLRTDRRSPCSAPIGAGWSRS